jgi:hypothetical protein
MLSDELVRVIATGWVVSRSSEGSVADADTCGDERVNLNKRVENYFGN